MKTCSFSIRNIILLLLAVILTGCMTPPLEQADRIALPAGLVRHYINTPLFTYTTYTRITDDTQPLHVYIEGDGVAWLSRYQPSPDPTPDNPMALTLATLDPAANVAYLARPCQFTPRELNPHCQVTYWTGKRFSQEVINSLSQALDQLKAHGHISKLALTGYSGGGAVAALLAEQRDDIQSLRTVAGYLDITYVNQQHNVSAMPESLNPIDKAWRLEHLPQVHFSGEKDLIISPEVARRFVNQAGPLCAKSEVVAKMDHRGPWERQWPRLLDITPACNR
ncbi:alpha/beta hydrolase [Erwinia sp. AnSW2-5]|uniref:alpha/beta hydrolase n=1 Tax=Erwinia sp. AnSW2-5 TaxID=3367692 RepID=UPI00385C4D73